MNIKKFGRIGLVSATVLGLTAFAATTDFISTPVSGVFSSINSHAVGFAANPNMNNLIPLDSTNSGNQLIKFVVTMKFQHPNQLAKLIQEQNDPNSPQFQKYLTVDQFTEKFGPSYSDYLQVISYLTSHNVRIVNVTPNRLLIEGEATNDTLNKLFGSVNGVYKAPNGMTVIKTVKMPKVPGQFKTSVSGIILQNNNSYFHSYMKVNHDASASAPTGYGPQQIDTVYNYPNANNQNNPGTLSGKGVTIAIATAQVYSPSDVNGFWNQYGISRTGTIENIYIGGQSKTLNPETTLDLEQIGADAPGANIMMYMSRTPTSLDFALMFNRIVTDNKANIISHSWGAAEGQQNPNSIETEHEIFEEAAAQGIAVFAASGDSGAYDTTYGFAQSNTPSVDYPSSDPFVTAVGGTTLVLNGDGSRDVETAWYGSGGGVSSIFGKPIWQVGSGVPNDSNRNSADVSMDADPATGMPVFYQNQWMEAGGTSFAAPNWAAGWALAEEEAGHRIAMPDMYIYKIANSSAYSSIFYDVTYGNNGDNGVGPGYNSGTGYDHPTGWGTPNMTALGNWLANDKAAAPATPAAPSKTTATPASPAAPSKTTATPASPAAPSKTTAAPATGSTNSKAFVVPAPNKPLA